MRINLYNHKLYILIKMSNFTENDLVIYKNKNKVMSGGYEVKSMLLNDNFSAINNENTAIIPQKGGKVSDIFSHLAIPTGLFMVKEANKVAQYDNIYHNEMYDNSLYEKLLDHVSPSSRKLYNKRTRKANNILNKKSRKNRR